ncbi:MAG: DNA adenine methylase [Deinococcota bacterium]|jgi:DNA adenine methylase|nr:DNA adenine methylase [Deinococcota bacterium]
MTKTKDQPLFLGMDFDEALERLARVNTKDIDAAIESEPHETDAPPGIATPFIKWVGGKRSLMDTLLLKMPETFRDYHEPFVGGGALFFELVGRKRLRAAHLSDTNLDLVFAYTVIKKDPTALIEALKVHAAKHSDTLEGTGEYYYKVRAKTKLTEPVDIAARFIYMNKTGYNGLYRVNSKGEFNVPVGRYKNPGIVQESNIWACHEVLKVADIEHGEFDTIKPQRGDFVYFDPPYHPKDETSFTKYSKLDFSEQDQVRLRDFVVKLHKSGVKVMLSNSDTLFIKDLYKSNMFKIAIVQAPRFVNCKSNKRNAVDEVLITNY